MDDLRIGIILGSTRPGRRGAPVADWVLDQAASRTSAKYELVDIAEFGLPLYDEPLPAFAGHYTQEHTIRWSQTIARFDAYVFVTPEYNHSTSAALKNAIDYLYPEWNNKAAAFVAYGSMGGARAIEHLREITAEVQLAGVRQTLNFLARVDFDADRNFIPNEYHADLAAIMFDQLENWADALRSLRTAAH
jgi:NAD(P)H-dependent FMN reductase